MTPPLAPKRLGVSLHIHPELAARVREIAESDQRSVNSLLNKIIGEWVSDLDQGKIVRVKHLWYRVDELQRGDGG